MALAATATMLAPGAVLTTTSVLASRPGPFASPHLGVGYPAGEGLLGCRQGDSQNRPRSHVHRGRGAEFRPIGQVHLNADPVQDVARRVFHSAYEGVALEHRS